MEKTVLKMSGISKQFSGVYALRDVSFDLREGEVHAPSSAITPSLIKTTRLDTSRANAIS